MTVKELKEVLDKVPDNYNIFCHGNDGEAEWVFPIEAEVNNLNKAIVIRPVFERVKHHDQNSNDV